jgi:hypothetical protein
MNLRKVRLSTSHLADLCQRKVRLDHYLRKKKGQSDQSRALVRVFQNTNGGTIEGRTRTNTSGGFTGQRTATYL